MKLYAFYLERGIDKPFMKEVFEARRINGVYYLEGVTPRWLCRHYVYDFHIGKVQNEISDYIFLLEDDDEKAKLEMLRYYDGEIKRLRNLMIKNEKKKTEVRHGATVSDTDTK